MLTDRISELGKSVRRDIESRIMLLLLEEEENTEGLYQSEELSPLSLLGKCTDFHFHFGF